MRCQAFASASAASRKRQTASAAMYPQASSGWSLHRSLDIFHDASRHMAAMRWLTHCSEEQAWSTTLTRISESPWRALMRRRVSSIAVSMQNSALACSVAVLSLATWVELRGVSARASSARASTSVCSVAAPLSEPSFSLFSFFARFVKAILSSCLRVFMGR